MLQYVVWYNIEIAQSCKPVVGHMGMILCIVCIEGV